MAHADLLVVHAGRLATMAGASRARRGRELSQLHEVADGAVAVRAGRILETGPTSALKARYRAKRTLDAEGALVTPGFIDAHTHLPFAGSRAFELPLKLQGRSYLQILSAGGGIRRTVRDTRKATEAELARLVARRLDTMLAWGTTTAEAKSGYGLNVADEVKQLRALKRAAEAHAVDVVPTLLAAHVVPEEYQGAQEDYVDLVARQIIPAVAKENLAAFCDAFLEQGAFTGSQCRTVLEAGRVHGMASKLHADEFTEQAGAELAARLGCTSAEHLLKVSDAGVQALAGSYTVAVLLPAVGVTSFLDAHAPARRMIDAGVAVALGTDFNPNCHVLTMPTILAWAVYHLRMRPEEALAAATINAAHAVGLADDVGSLEKGKQADLLVLDADGPEDLAYKVGPNPVRTVVKAGKVVNPKRR